MPKNNWYDPTPREREMVEEAAPSGGSFPDFTGSGSPEGVITADVGKSYVDTAGGALWFKVVDGTSNTGWACLGFDGSRVMLASPPGVANVRLTDLAALENSGNGILWSNGGADGEQQVLIYLGSTGQFLTSFNADGTTEFPGLISVTEIRSAGSGAALVLGDEFIDSGSGNGLSIIGTGVDGHQRVQIGLGVDGAFATKFNADGSTNLPGDVTLPAGKGPVIHDDANGHTYRIGSHNGALTLTQVT